MPRALSEDLRFRLISRVCGAGETVTYAARILDFPPSTASDIVNRFLLTNSIEPTRRHHGPTTSFTSADLHALFEIVGRSNHYYIREFQAELRYRTGFSGSVSTIWRMMKTIGLSHKRVRHTRYHRASAHCWL
jgi:transposase